MFQHINNLKFIHVFAGWPGRSADGCVFKHSPLSQTLPQLMDNNSEYLRDNYHILGKKVFPLRKHNFNSVQKKFREIFTLVLYQVKIYIYFERSKNRKKITTSINICV